MDVAGATSYTTGAMPPDGKPPDPAQPLRILVVCRHIGGMIQLLARFGDAGHAATGRYTDDEAAAALVERDFDVLVLDADIEPASRERLEASLRARAVPGARVVQRREGQDLDELRAEI